jgi:hypothetical protein
MSAPDQSTTSGPLDATYHDALASRKLEFLPLDLAKRAPRTSELARSIQTSTRVRGAPAYPRLVDSRKKEERGDARERESQQPHSVRKPHVRPLPTEPCWRENGRIVELFAGNVLWYLSGEKRLDRVSQTRFSRCVRRRRLETSSTEKVDVREDRVCLRPRGSTAA